MEGCPALTVYQNPGPSPGEPKFMPIRINGLENDEDLGAFKTPSGAFSLDGQVYLFFVTRIQDAKPHFALQSIMAKADKSLNDWSPTGPPVFRRLYTVSMHDPVQDPGHPPDEASGPGKFMFNPVTAMEHAALDRNGLLSGLPQELRQARTVVFVFGSSFKYNRSNLYLAAFRGEDAERGRSGWFYYAGRAGWTREEKAAEPLLPGDPRIGNHSVAWVEPLKRFVLMYGNVQVRWAPSPWGPWSEPSQVFSSKDPWASKLIHRPGRDPLRRSVLPVTNLRTGEPVDLKDPPGVPYGPYVIDRPQQNSDGSTTLYLPSRPGTPTRCSS